MLKELLRRRVPQIVGAYLAGGWLVLEITDWAVNRYVLSSHLVDFIVVGWLLLIPGVFLVAWFHGSPGRDRWTRLERIGIAVNLVVAGAVLFGLFRGRDLGAATTTIVVEDEEGNAIEREVPKSEFRKTVVVFPFDNRTADPDLDWLEYGLPAALRFDLDQDLFLNLPGAEKWMGRLREEGFEAGLDVPLTLKRDVSERLHADHFISGTIEDSAGIALIRTSLYETRRGKRLAERSLAWNEMLDPVDGLSEQLRRDLELPVQHIEDTPDLPAAEILTADLDALRLYVAGEEAALKRLDYGTAAERWEEAANADPRFAMAWLRLFEARTLVNDAAGGEEALESAMDLLYKLPERVQFPVKVTYYWIVRRDVGRATATARMWAELFPDDVSAHANLAKFYGMQAKTVEAIEELEKVVELDPGRAEQLQEIAALYRSRGEYEEALEYLRRYADASPGDPGAFTAIADLQRRIGGLRAAREAYNRALVIDPGNVDALISLARLDRDVGAFADAERGYVEAMEASATPEQHAAVEGALQGYYGFRGQMARAITHMRGRWNELAVALPPFNLVQQQLNDLSLYARAGRIGDGRTVLDSLTAQLPEEFRVLAAMGEFSLANESDDPEAIEASAAAFGQFIDSFGLEQLRFVLSIADGRVAELRGDCRRAIRNYEEALKLSPSTTWTKLDLARCYRKLGRLEAGRGHLEDLLREVPMSPRVHYELALSYLESEDRDAALDHLRTAMQVWQDADPEYPRARRAREKLAELERGG